MSHILSVKFSTKPVFSTWLSPYKLSITLLKILVKASSFVIFLASKFFIKIYVISVIWAFFTPFKLESDLILYINVYLRC